MRRRRSSSLAGPCESWKDAVPWCEWGPPEELSNIRHRREHEATTDQLPDYRIICIFIDRNHRHKGVSAVALRGALDLIAQADGSVVEGCPHDKHGKRESVLYSGTRAVFEQVDFTYDRPKGTTNRVMRTTWPARVGREGGTGFLARHR